MLQNKFLNLNNKSMKELSIEKMEMVSGGWFSQYCQTDGLAFLAGQFLVVQSQVEELDFLLV